MRRQSLRPVPLALVMALGLGTAAVQAQGVPAAGVAVPFAIQAQPLAEALNAWAQQTRTQLIVQQDLVAGKTAAAVSGALTPQQALDRLLAGTGLVAVAEGWAVVIKAASAAGQPVTLQMVTVSGKAPGSTTEGTDSYTTDSTSSSTRLNLTPQETPQAITVLTRQRLDDQKLETLTEALEATPGIIVQKPFVGQGQDGNDIYARGSYLRNYQIDGVPTSLAVGPFLANTMSYDRIEVVRGATGIMNGLGTPAATINLIRKRPTTTPQKSVTARVGSWDRYGAGVDISNPLNDSGTARARVVADIDRQGAWVDRFDQKKRAFYGIAEFDLSDSTLATVGFNHLTQNASATIMGRPLFYTNGQRIAFSPSDNSSPAWDFYNQSSNSLFASLEHRFAAGWVGKVEYSQARYRDDVSTEGIPDTVDLATGGLIDIWPYRSAGKTRQDNLDAYLSGMFSLFGRDHELIGGVTLSRRRSTSTLYEDDWANYPVGFNIFNWADTAPAPTFFQTGEGHVRERNYSAYLNGRFQLGDATSLLLGGRTVRWQLDETTRQRKEQVFVPYVGLVHALNDAWSVYGSYTKIFQPQDGVVFLYGRPGASPDPEQGEGYEVGVKGSLYGGQLTTSLAVFQMDVSNLAFWNREARVYEVHGETRTRGVEIDVSGKLAEGWQLGAGYAYARTEDAQGQRALTRLPLQSLKLFTTYRLPGAWNQLTLGGGVNWQSAIRSSGTINYKQGGVALVNLMARYAVDKNLSVALHVNNVFDKRYFSTVANNYGTFGEPRRITASMKYSF